MAKTGGMGDNLYVNGVDVSGDTNQISEIGGGNEPFDSTGINASAHERLGGRRDGRMKWVSYYNVATSQAHPTYKLLPTTDVPLMYCRGTALGSPAACLFGKQLRYDGTLSEDGALTFDLEELGNAYGLEWGELHTAGRRTDTSATNGAGVDSATGAQTEFGAQAYIQIFSAAATLAGINVQSSSDNGGGDAFSNVAGLAFTCTTAQAPKAERAATAAGLSIERYLRVITTGTFTSINFALTVVRNELAVSF